MSGYSKSEEDYLEALYLLQRDNKVVRVKDVAEALDVKMPSVVYAMRSLIEKGLAGQEKYGHIELTKKGEKAGKDVYDRHKLLFTFFHEILGLENGIAEEDACSMEHFLSPETRERLLKIVEFTRACKEKEIFFLKRFMHYVNTGEIPDTCSGCGKS